MKYYITQTESGKYIPSVLTDDLKEEAELQGYAIYDTIEDCQSGCDNLNEEE